MLCHAIHVYACVTVVKDLELLVNTLTSRVAALEHGSPAPSSTVKSAVEQQGSAAAAANHKKEEDGAGDEEDDFELFGSDEVGIKLR